MKMKNKKVSIALSLILVLALAQGVLAYRHYDDCPYGYDHYWNGRYDRWHYGDCDPGYYCDRYNYDKYDFDRYNYYNRGIPNTGISYSVNQGPPINGTQDNKVNGVTNNNSSNGMISLHGGNVVTAPNPQCLYQTDVALGSFFKTNNKWYFKYTNGALATNVWININSKWFYFDPNAIMAEGVYVINGTTYFFNEDGSMVVGSVILDGITHYFDSSGAMVY